MIVSNDFAYIHLHRTGGHYIRELIFTYFPEAAEIGYHFPLKLLPQAHRNKPVYGVVRNPWDWYVSWYAFNTPHPRNPLFSFISKQGMLTFSSMLKNLVRLKFDKRYQKEFESTYFQNLPQVIFGNNGAGITQTDIREWLNSKLGYYSWLVRHMFNNYSHPNLKLTRFEEFDTTVHQLFLQHTQLSSAEKKEGITNLFSKNASGRKQYIHYYDNSLKNLISDFEIDIISRFCYSFSSALHRQ